MSSERKGLIINDKSKVVAFFKLYKIMIIEKIISQTLDWQWEINTYKLRWLKEKNQF